MTTTYESRVDIDHDTIIPRATLALTYEELRDIRHFVYQGIQYETHVSHDKASEIKAWDIYYALEEVGRGLQGPFARPAAPDPQPQPDIMALQAKVNESHTDGLLRLQEQQFQVFREPIVRHLSDEQVSLMVSDEEWAVIAERIGRGLDLALDEMENKSTKWMEVGTLSGDAFAVLEDGSIFVAPQGTVRYESFAAVDPCKGFPVAWVVAEVPEDILAGEHENHDDEGVLGDCGA